MKKLTLALAICTSALFFSCGEKDKEETEMSTLTPDAHKENFVNSGVDVVNQLEGLTEMEGIDALGDLQVLLENSNSVASQVIAQAIGTTKILSISESKASLKSTNEGIGTSFREEAGIYTYNKATNSFVKTTSTDIIYKFPIGTSTSNNGELKISNFTYSSISIEGELVEMPKTCDLSLKNGSTPLVAFKFTAAYSSTGTPISLTESLTMSDYTLTAAYSYVKETVSASQAFTKGTATIFSYSLSANGKFDVATLPDTKIDSEQEILNSFNANFQISNFKLEGNLNWSGLEASAKEMEDDNVSEEKANKDLANALNQHAILTLRYVNDNKIIAKSDYYAYYETYYSESYWDINMRMKFNDGSFMDESFFDKGLDKLETDIDDLIQDFQTNY